MNNIIVVEGNTQTVVIVSDSSETVVPPADLSESQAVVVPLGVQGPKGDPGEGVLASGSYFPSGW
jgi:hypothetical protein